MGKGIDEGQSSKGIAKEGGLGKIEVRGIDISKFGEHVDVICYNCGTPGHHKASCKKPRICFICKQEDHMVEGYLVREKGHSVAKYIGSAAGGLGFYNVQVPQMVETLKLDFTNHGKMYIETREIS
jgi:hypothetical protein